MAPSTRGGYIGSIGAEEVQTTPGQIRGKGADDEGSHPLPGGQGRSHLCRSDPAVPLSRVGRSLKYNITADLPAQRQMDKNHKYYYEDMEYAEMTLGVVKEVVKVDEYTVKFVLHHPFGPFLRNIAMFCNAIVSPAAVEKYGDDFFKNPVGTVGTGPFKFVKWDRDSQIVLEANKEYWGGAPKVDQVIFRVIPENSVRLAELQAGNIHMMDGLDPNDIATVEKDPNLTLM
ncbi:MAG: ABC transporter substrate-binding protein, partial [Bacillota bacterium]|nr:ABC transporter substrate-binding protein [Bacillota bacterium]